MAVESAADRASFFSSAEFGAAAIYRTRAGTSVQISGQFDSPRINVQIGEAAQSLDSRPTFTCRADDLPDDAVGGDAGDSLTLSGVIYRVIDIEPDGTGLSTLTLGRN